MSSLNKGEQFKALKHPADLAAFLGVPLEKLRWTIYRTPTSWRYKTFTLPKKGTNAGSRVIEQPNRFIMSIQKEISEALTELYNPKSTTHGFIHGRNILSNAMPHSGATFVLNIDLEDFFPSVHFGRVRGLFQQPPFKFDPDLSRYIAQICCFQRSLPHGAPTSPIIANMICKDLDRRLQQLARQYGCHFTRYADDITFSTHSRRPFPEALAVLDEGHTTLGEALINAVKNAGFNINPRKSRLQPKASRQMVTGLVVNRKPNVTRRFKSQVRAMLHAWERWGLDKAEQEYHNKYLSQRSRAPFKELPSFKEVVRGKLSFIAFIIGEDNNYVFRMRQKLDYLDV